MEEWLRCNTCFHRMKNSSRVFYLTGCDHVFCCYCVDRASKKCPECDTVSVGIIPMRETSSRQKMYRFESVSSHAKILIERPRFCRVQYLILSRYAWKTDEAYDELVKSIEQLIEATELSRVLQERLKEKLAKHRRLPINVARPAENERYVPVTTKSTSEIFANNAQPQLAEPKSEYFPENVESQPRNWRETSRTSIYDYPQPVERESEDFSKSSQRRFLDWRELPQTSDHHYPQLDELKSEYSSKKSQSRRRISIKEDRLSDEIQLEKQSILLKPAKQSKPKSCLRKKRPVREKILPQGPTCDYSQQKRSRTECSSTVAQGWSRDPRSLIDTPNLNYAQWKNRATKFVSANPQPPDAEFRDLRLHNNWSVRSTNHCDQPYQCTIAYAPVNTEYRAAAIIDAAEVSGPMNEKTSYPCDRYGEPQNWRTGKCNIGIHGNAVVHDAAKNFEQSEQSTPRRHLPGNPHDSLNHSQSNSQQQNSYRQHEPVLPSSFTPPTQTTSYSTVPRGGCALHSRLDQPVTSSSPGMDDKKVVQAASTVASGPQVRNKSGLDGSGLGASISGVRRRNGPQPGLRSPAAKRPLSAPVALQGWLHKQGSEGLMLWKKRWFVLSEYCLFYYKGPEEERLLGSILLPSYRVTICSPEDKVNKKFAFKAEHANMRTYHFAADTRDGMNQWVNVLTLATLLQDPNPGGGEVQVALDMPGLADGDRSARPSVSSISSILNQSADDSDSGFHGFQSRDDPSHASNNNSSPNSANTASFPNLSGSNSNSIGNGINGNNSNDNNPEHILEDVQPHHPVMNGWMQPPAQFGQPGTSQQQYAHVLPGPLQQHPQQQQQQQQQQHQQQQQLHQHQLQQQQYHHQQLQYQQQIQQQQLSSGQLQAMKQQHAVRPQQMNQQQHQHQPGPSNVQSVQQPPRNFGQPVYANAPPKPRRLTDGSNEYSTPSPDPEFRKSPVQSSNVRLTTKSPISEYERGNAIYASRLAQQQQQPQATLRTDKSGLNYGYSQGQPAERRTPDTYGRSAKPRTARGNSDYEDVYGGPQLYQRPSGPVGYTKGPAPVPIPIYGQHQPNQTPVCPAVSPSNAPIMRQPRSQPPPRPHSADFLEYEANRRPDQQSSNSSGNCASQQRRPQRPKSSLDVVNSADVPPAGDGYFYSEERYAAQMRQSAVYLHQTPQHHQQQRNQSLSRATTPSKTNSLRIEDPDSNNSVSVADTPCSSIRKSQREYSQRQHPMATQSLQRYTEASSNNEALLRRSLRERSYDPSGPRDSLIHGESGTVPRRMPRDFDPSSSGGRLLVGESATSHAAQNCHSAGHAGPRRWSEQQFARSASARLPRTRYPNDQRDENEYADRSTVQGSRDGERRIQQREESMKRLLEWKQRMLQSPLTRKPGSATTNGGGTAQNELSSYYKRQALLDLAAHEATVAEARHSRRRDDNHRPHVRSKSTDGRRSVATNVSRYNSYSSDDEELNDVRRKRTRRPSHAGRIPRHLVEENPTSPVAVGSSHEVVLNRASPSKGGAVGPHQIVTSSRLISPPRDASSNYDYHNAPENPPTPIGGIPPDAGYEEVTFSQAYQKDYTISVSTGRQGAATNSSTAEQLMVKTPKKPSGILKTPTNYPIGRHGACSETSRLSTLAGYIPGEAWQIQKNVQWGASDDKHNWDSKIDESRVIKEFSYQYIKPEELVEQATVSDDQIAVGETKNLVQSRIRSFETSTDETALVRDVSAMQEPLKVSPSQATEAHVSRLESATRKVSPKIREFALRDTDEDAERSTDRRPDDDVDPCSKETPDGGKSVKDLLADFERKSQQVRRQENDRREEVTHRGVFSDTETLLYDTGSDLDQPDRSDGEEEDLYQTISKRCESNDDGAGATKRAESGDKPGETDTSKMVVDEDSSVLDDLEASSNPDAFARLSMTESMVTHGDQLSDESATPSPPLNLDDINPEEHYLPMSPRKAILDPNNDDRPNPKMMESLFANLRGEESSYVEMAQNGMGRSLLAPDDDGGKHDSGDYSTLDTPHYEFVCVADNKVEPVYMEVSQLSENEEKKAVGKSTKKRDKRDGHGNNGQLQVRPDLPDILTALKSDSSDADDESSKDLDSIDAPRHPRFSLSDTFRPASYYLGASRAMIAELHDSSDSELVSPPPIPTSPPPLDDLDSLDLQDSIEDKKVSPQVASTRDNSSTRSSPKSWNKPAGQVDSHCSSSRFSGATISSTFRDSRISLESVSGSDSLELRNPDEEARHRQLKRRPVSDEVCEVLDSLDELESLGSRFDGASIDLDRYLEELQARDAFNVDLYAKDLSYNSIYGFNENMVVTDKLQKQSPRELTNKPGTTSSNSLDQPFQYGCRGKTSSASSLPSMRVSDTPPAHQHSQSFTGDAHYENVASFSPLRGSPAVRLEQEQNQDDSRLQKDLRHAGQIISHSRDSGYTFCGTSNSAMSYHRPNSALSTTAYVHQQHSGMTRSHARSASHDTPRDLVSPNHRSSSSQDSTFYPASSFAVNPSHQHQRNPAGENFAMGLSHHHHHHQRHQHQHVESDHAGAPYYYSDLQVSVSNIDAQLNRHSIGHTSRLPQLNNQRDDSGINKRSDIGRLVNPITRQIPRRIEVEDIDEARRIAAELRKSSGQYLVEKKAGLVDRKNFYESDTLRRAKSTDPLPNEPLPDVSTVNLYPLGLRDKSNSQTNLELDNIASQLDQVTHPSHRRSRSLEGLLDDVGLQSLVEQRHLPDRVSSVPPIGTRDHEDPPNAFVSSFTPITVEDGSNFGGEDPWEQDTLWRESLRRVSLRQARSLDNLENAARSGESSQQESRTRTRITRGATYVNDSVLQRQQLQSSPQETVERRSNERNQTEAVVGPEDDAGTYESLSMSHRLTGDYIWDPDNEAYRRQSSTSQHARSHAAGSSKHFLSEGNLPPSVPAEAKNRTSTSTSGSFELDREKLRQWDLVSSACLLQEQQRTSMAESGRGLPVSEVRQQQCRTIEDGDGRSMMMMMIESSRGRNDGRDGNDVGVNFERDDGKQIGQLSGATLSKNCDDKGLKGEEEEDGGGEEEVREGADECRDGAAASGSGSVIGRDPLPPRAVSTSQLPQGTLTQPPSGVSTLPLPRANGGHRQQLPTFPVHQSTTQSAARLPTVVGSESNGNLISRVASAGDIRLSPVSASNDTKSPRVSSPCGSSQVLISPARNMRIVSPIENRVSSPNNSERHLHSPSDRKVASPIGREMDRAGDGSLKQMQRIVQGRESSDFLHKRKNANNNKQRSGGVNGSGGRIGSAAGSSLVQVSAGELLGRTHEELVLLLIQLRRQSTTLCKAMETCHMEIEAQAILTELDNPRRLENLQKLEELKKHLMDLEKQYEKGKPLVNLVDNMVKLGSLYNRNTNNGTGSISGSRHDLLQSQDPVRDQRDRLEFNQRVQEQRLLAEERRDWDRLSPDHGQLQAKVQQLYKLDRLLQEESGTLHSLQQDKDILEKALGGLRHKLQGSRSNPAEVERYRKQQLLLERELSRVRLLLAHNSKKLEETVAENARLEQDLVVLRQKLQTSRRYAGNMARDSSGTTVALESELRRVQQLVGDLQRQRQELSVQVRQLTEKSHSLVQQIRPVPTSTSSQIHNPKKRSQSSWLETDLDSGMTQDHGLDSPSSPALAASLPRNRQNGSSHQQHSRSRNTGKELPGIAYKENSHTQSPTQQQQQHVRQAQSNQQQAFLQSHQIMESTQDHISALSPQLREQIQQHQLKQQLLKDQMQGKASPVQTNATPLYVNTDSRRHDVPKRTELAVHNGMIVPPPEYVPPPPPPCTDESILMNGNYNNQDDNKFAGIHNREKQEIKTVRIVKRESERRQRDRGDRTGNIGIPVINGLQQLPLGSVKRQNDDDLSGQPFEKVHLGRVIEESPMVHAQCNLRISDIEDMQFQRSMSLPRGFGGQRPHPGLHQGPVPPPPRSDSMNALRNIMARRHRVRFENHEGSSDSTSPYTDSPTSSSQIPLSSPNYSTSPSYSPSHQSYLAPYARGSSSHQQQLSPCHGNPGYYVGAQETLTRSIDNPSGPISPDPVSPTLSQSVKERLFGSVASLNSLTESPQLSPVFKSEAAKQIIKEMTEKKSDAPRRRPIPKEKRRHYTVSSSKPMFDLEDAFSKMGMGRARDDLDMERALRPRINAPDVVRSTLSHKELKYNESTIDQLLGTPNKILIPERYVPEQTPELSAEEKKQRLKKADAIRKMLSETAVTTSEGDDDVVHNEKSHSLKKKVAEEKRQRDHILQLNQILAKQVMEKSKMVAVKALATLPLNSETSFDEDDLSPITPLPLYQQRENFYS